MQIVRPERESPLSLAFNVVPAYDVVLGAAAATQPEKHELPSAWARRVRQTLAADARRDLTYFFADPMVLGAGAIRLVPALSDGSPAAFVAALESADAGELVSLLVARGSGDRQVSAALKRTVRQRATPEDDRLVANNLAAMRADTRRRAVGMLADPEGTRARYVSLITQLYERRLAHEIPDFEALLAQRAKQARRTIGKLSPKDVIARATGGFTLQSQGARSVTLVPSYFAAPFVYVVREGRDPILVYGVRPAETSRESDPIDSQSIKVLKALADETRLHILLLLAARPMYGQQLADSLGVSHPTVSHHMAQLRIAGLTRTELDAEGNKTYFVRPETLGGLFSDLGRALRVDATHEAVV